MSAHQDWLDSADPANRPEVSGEADFSFFTDDYTRLRECGVALPPHFSLLEAVEARIVSLHQLKKDDHRDRMIAQAKELSAALGQFHEIYCEGTVTMDCGNPHELVHWDFFTNDSPESGTVLEVLGGKAAIRACEELILEHLREYPETIDTDSMEGQ